MTEEQIADAVAKAAQNNALKKLAEGKVYQDNAKPNFGRYVFQIQAHRMKIGGHWGDTGIAEMKVIKAENLSDWPEGVRPENASRVDSTVSYTEGLSKPGDAGTAALGRFQTHLARIFAFDKPLNLGQLGLCFGEKQPSAFMYVECEVLPKVLKADGKKYQKDGVVKNYRWAPYELSETEANAIHASRAAAKLPELPAVLEELEKLGG
jgi:hypothetical protein